jgi:hypothetical protein
MSLTLTTDDAMKPVTGGLFKSCIASSAEDAKEEPRSKEYSHQLWVQLFSFGGKGAAEAVERETLPPSPI